MPSQKELHDFSDSLIAIHQRQANEMDIYADSLRMRNRELNRTLNKLINDLDEQAQTAFSQRELKMAEAEKMSFFLMAGVIGMAIILLIIRTLSSCVTLTAGKGTRLNWKIRQHKTVHSPTCARK